MKLIHNTFRFCAPDSTDGSTNAGAPPAAPETKGPTALDTIKMDFQKSGGKVDSKAAVKARDAYLASNAAVADLEAKLVAARAANAVNCKALMQATGAQPLKFGGKLYTPSCRGTALFYKAPSEVEALEIK